ncbi:MAG: hypothetical protein JF597_27760 [Streptomyces sp.]|uniref:hypothetical protein n=1 Tax=Streptomyces sp. TaxID=1931 RepID=UPI0025E4A169|nr:hypothetical protein [Streptomyces sp.]MBW8797258.1 hypothetical protein [Streptomyces sp.]
MDAVQLQLVTGNAKASGALTLYPHGITRPGTADTAFEPGRAATAETTVQVTPTGSVDLYNGSSGAVTVNIATVGLQSHAQYADTYPGVYSLSFTKGDTAAGRALVRVGTGGEADLYNAATVPVNVYADLVGDYDVFPAAS